MTMPKSRTARALVLTLALAGCGSNSQQLARAPEHSTPSAAETTRTSVTATPAAMTHATFIAAVDASCSKDHATADTLGDRFESAMERNALPEAGRLLKRQLALLERHMKRITALVPPAADAPAMTRYMRAERRLIGYAKRMADSLLEKDISEVTLLVEPFQSERKRRATAAIDLGADKCGT